MTDALKRLHLFNEKASELQSYSFIPKAFHEQAGVTVNWDFEKKTVTARRVGADKEARAAMCLLLRFFVQPRDRIELHQMAQLYKELPVEDRDKTYVSLNLKDLDDLLDKPTEMAFNGNPITHRLVLETFLYGDQAHTNEDKRALLNTWREVPPIYVVLENFFEYAAGQTIRYVVWLAELNAHAIQMLEKSNAL